MVDDAGCWLWTASLDGAGYSKIRVDGRLFNAHRWYYEMINGPIPKGLQLDHLCRVRRCVNPDHLEPVTQQENIRRGEGIGVINARKTHCPKGHPYAGDNLIVRSGSRGCRTCVTDRRRRPSAPC